MDVSENRGSNAQSRMAASKVWLEVATGLCQSASVKPQEASEGVANGTISDLAKSTHFPVLRSMPSFLLNDHSWPRDAQVSALLDDG